MGPAEEQTRLPLDTAPPHPRCSAWLAGCWTRHVRIPPRCPLPCARWRCCTGSPGTRTKRCRRRPSQRCAPCRLRGEAAVVWMAGASNEMLQLPAWLWAVGCAQACTRVHTRACTQRSPFPTCHPVRAALATASHAAASAKAAAQARVWQLAKSSGKRGGRVDWHDGWDWGHERPPGAGRTLPCCVRRSGLRVLQIYGRWMAAMAILLLGLGPARPNPSGSRAVRRRP